MRYNMRSCQNGRFGEETARFFICQLILAIDHCHKLSILHRDIKPENIVLRGSNNEPVLIDFGAFKETLNAEASGSGTVSIGTHGYMPIEQVSQTTRFL